MTSSRIEAANEAATRAWLESLEGRSAKSVPVMSYATTGNIWGTGGYTNPPGAEFDYTRAAGTARRNSLVAICRAYTRRKATKGRIRVGTQWETGERDPLESHPLLEILRRPNPVWSSRSTLAAIAEDLKIDGNAYAIKARDGTGRFRELWYCPVSQIEVEPENRRDADYPIRRYWVTSYGIRTPYAPEEIIHFRDGIDPEVPYLGLSAFKAQLRNIAGLNAAETYTAAILRKGHAGTVLVPREAVPTGPTGDDPSPEEDELRAEKRRIAHATSGESAGGIYATTIPLDKLDIGMGPEEILLDRILDRPECMVLAAFGYNALALGLPSSRDTRTYSNLREAIRDAWDNGIEPVQDVIAEELAIQGLFRRTETGELVSEFRDADELSVWWDRKDVAEVQEDATERASRSVTLFSSGILPQNLALAAGGWDPVDGGDARYVGDPPPESSDPDQEGEDDAEEDDPVDADMEEEDVPADSEDGRGAGDA